MSAAMGDRLRFRWNLTRGHLDLIHTRRQSIRVVGRAEKGGRRETHNLALKNLAGALWALRLLPEMLKSISGKPVSPIGAVADARRLWRTCSPRKSNSRRK